MIPTEELSILIRDLAAPDPPARRIAAETLAAADERAIYPLIRSLRDENSGVQDAAMRSLIAIGGEVTAYMALPLLRESPFLRNTARIILRQIGPLSVPLLRPLLADKDDDIRTFAVDLIADIGSCDYPRDIARLLESDPNQNVRASAAKALGVLGYRDGLPALISALKDSEWVSFSALESIAGLGDDACLEPVMALLQSPSETARYAAIEALGKMGSGRSSNALIGLLPKSSEIEKAAIVKSLIQIGITPAMAEVADLLVDLYVKGDWDERLLALRGLAELRHEQAIPVILDSAGSLDPSAPESEDRLEAVKQALMLFGCASPLIAALSDPAVRFRAKTIAIEVIAELHCPEAVPALVRLLNGDLREVRRSAVQALAEIPGEEALEALRKCIDDRDGHVRSAALSALGRIGDKTSFDRLFRHLTVENYRDVLEETVKALLKINAERLFSSMETLSPPVKEMVGRYTGNVDILLALSGDREQAIRLAAVTGLGRVRDGRARKRLSEALGDRDPEIRKAAVIALGSLNPAVNDIKTALGDGDMWVRLYAVKALGESQDPGAAKAIIPLLSDKDVPVVLSAIDALVKLGKADAATLGVLRNHGDETVRQRITSEMEHLC
jgi:HEAT repeat protein